MNSDATITAARARLALRAERAFGLEAVRRVVAGEADSAAGSPANAAPPAASAPPAAAAPRSEDSVSASTPVVRSLPAPVVARSTHVIKGRELATEQKRIALEQLDEMHVKGCQKCPLREHRTRTVFGEGDVDAKVMFIGEGPGENEDLSGRPFVGRAGDKLSEMIRAMGLTREQVYICNIVKCRPPNNRAPAPDEVAACTPYLDRQVETIRPKVIVALGAPAAKYILGDDRLAITRIRGQWREYRGIKVMPTFHPAYMLRQYTPEVRGQVWADLQAVMDELGLPRKRSASEAP